MLVVLTSTAGPAWAVAADLVRNGGLEQNGGVGTSSFAQWTTLTAWVNGEWWVQTGSDPTWYGVFRGQVPVPPEGTFAAMTNQAGPGRRLMYQDIFIPPQDKPLNLSFEVYLNNRHTRWASPPNLEFLPTTVPNQQFRVDLMDPTAPLEALTAAAIFFNVYATQPGDPLVSGYNLVTVAVPASVSGRTVRLRFAEVDNQANLIAGIDNVRLVAQVESVPTLSDFLMLTLAATLAGVALLAMRRPNGI